MARYFRLSDGRKVTADNDGAVRELIKWGVDNKIGVSEYFIYQDPQNKRYEVDAWARERALQHPALKGAVNVGEMGPRTAPDLNKPAQEPQKKQLQQSEPTTNVDLRNVRNTSKAVEYQHPGGGFQEFYSQVQSGKVTAPQVKNIDPAKYTEEQLNKNITEPRLREAYQSWQNRRTETPYQPNSQTRLDKAVSERERIGRDIENLVLARPPDSETELLKNWKISYEGEVDKYNFYTEQIIPYRATGLNAAQRELADSAAKWADKYPALAATVGQLGMGLWGLATSPYNLITAGMGRDNEAYYALRQGISQGLAGEGLWNDVGSGFYSFGLVAPLAIGTALSGGTASPLLAKALGVAGTATMQMSITSDIMRELYQDDNYLSFMEAGAAAVSGAAQQLTENLSLSFQTKALSNAFKLGGQAGLRQATSELVRKAFAPTLGEQAVGLLQTFGTEILEENLQWAEDAVIQNVMLGKPMPTWEETKQAVRDNTIGALFGVVLQSGAMMGVQARQSRTSAQALKALAADESGWTSPKLAQQAIDQLTAGQIGEAAETAQKAHQALISSDAAMDEKAKRHVLKAVGSVYGAANMYDAQTAANVFIEEKAAKKELAALEQEKRKLEKAIPSQQTEDKLFLLNEKIEEADAELVRLQGVITENAHQKEIYNILNEASEAEQKARKAGDKALDKLTDSKAYKEATQEEQRQMMKDAVLSDKKSAKLQEKATEKYREANLYKLRQTPAYKQAAPEVQTQMEEAELQRQQEAIAAEFEAARQKAISEQQEAEKAAETASNEATEEIEVIPDIIDQLEAKKAAIRQERQDINKELTEYRKLMDQQGGWLPSVTPEQKKAYHEVKQRQKEVNRKLNEVGIEIRKEKAAQKKAAAEQQKPKKKAKPKEKKKTEKPQETEAKEQPKKSKKAEAKETKKKEKPEPKKEAPQKEKEAEQKEKPKETKPDKKTETEPPAIEPYTPSARMRGGDKLRTEKFNRLYRLEKLRDAGVKKVKLGSATVGIETAIKRTENSLDATSQSEYWDWKFTEGKVIPDEVLKDYPELQTPETDTRTKSEALQETLPTIPDKTADDALLGMVKSHILSITRKDRTTTVNFKDGRQLVINHITQEAMMTEAGKTGVMYAGRTQGEKGKNVYTAIVDLVDGLNQGNRTLFHEAFHVVWKLFLNSEQISYIKQYYRAKANKGELVRKYVVTRQGTEMALYWTKEQFNALNKERQAEALEEGAAYGFEHWLGSRTDTAPTTMIGKLWQRLADAIRHALVKLNLANQNAKLTDIFHAVASDKLTGQGEQGADNRTKPYVGYSWSVNAQKAKDAGMLTKTELKQKYKYTDAEIELAGADEWHHTSNHYNKTNFYDPDAFKQRLMDAIDSMGFSSLADYRMALKSVPKMVSALAKKHPDIPEPYIKTYYNRLILDNNIFKRRFIEKGGTADGWAYKEVVSLIFGDSYVLNSKVPPRGEEWTAEHEKRENIVNKLLEATGNQTYALNNADQIQIKDHARYKQIEEKNLVTIHNIPVDSIEKVNSRGGLVMPSIAIIDATKTKFTGFGDASLIGDEKMIQPSAKQPLYTSDAYTPTYPKVYEIVKMDKNLEALAEYLSKKTKKKVTTWDLEANIEDQGSERYVASLLYGVMDYKKAQKEAIRTLEQYPINIEEKLFAGYTASGKRRYIPHTAENALRIMRKDSKDPPNTFWGTSSLRGALAAKFSSLAQAKKNRDMILSEAEMKPIEAATEEMFLDIAERANAVRKNQRAFYHSDIASDIYDMARYGWGRIADWYKDDSIKEDFRSFISHLRSLPTQYFEYKPQRVMGINEFVAAVIPTGTKASTAKALRDAGLKVYKYEAGDSESRFEVTKKASEELGIRYKPVPTADVAENKTTKSPYRAYLTPFRGDITKPKILSRLKNNNAPKGRIKLFEEIRKFDSAEELSDHIFYHGTTNYIDKGLKPSIAFSDRFVEQSGGGGYGQKYWAISLSKSKNIASDFSGTQSAVTVYPVILRKGANVISMPDIQDAADLDDIIVNLWENEIDAVYIGDPNGGEQELAVLNPKAIYTFDNPDTYAVFGKQRLNNLTPERIAEIYQIAQDRKGAVDRIRELPKEERRGAIRELTGDIRFKPVPTASEVAEAERQYAEVEAKYRIDGVVSANLDKVSSMSRDEFIASPPEGYKYKDFDEQGVAYYDTDGTIVITDNFFDNPEFKRDILYHEIAHATTDNLVNKHPDQYWGLVESGLLGVFNKEKQKWEGIKGLTGKNPSESITEAIAQHRADKGKFTAKYGEKVASAIAEVDAKPIYTDAWLKAPNGKPTNLNERQWVQVRTPNFKKWFGDWENDPKNASKVVDENGEPLVVYNGRIIPTTKYDAETIGYTSGFAGNWKVDRSGIFFSDNKDFAIQYGENINDVFLNIRNLETYSKKKQIEFAETFSPFGEEREMYLDAFYFSKPWMLFDDAIGKKFVSYLKENGIDGYTFQEDLEIDDGNNPESNTYVAFSPNQIKSATANVGTFSENPDIRYRKLTERERAMRDDVWNEIMGRPPTPRAQTRPKVQTEPPEKEPQPGPEPQRPQPARPSQSKPPTEAEIDVLSERIGKDLGIAPAQVKEKLGRQMMAAWREAQGDISRLMESAAIRNFEEWVENNKPEGTDSRDLTWHWEEMLEYAAKVGLSREQIAQMVKSDRFDATAIGINLFQRMNYVGKLLVETEATLADRNWGTPAEREQKEAQYGILQAQFDELQAAYAMQGSEAGTVLWTRRQNKAQYLENLTRAAQALESKINRGSLELAEMRQELDGLERAISDLEKSFEMLLRVMDGKRYKDITEMSNAELEAERQKQAERLNDLRNRAEHLRYEIEQKVAAMQADKGRQEETQTQIRKIRKTGRKAKVIEIKERKPDVHDWIRAAWYNSVLAGVPTHMVNMSANVVNSLLEDVITLFAQGGKVAGAQFAEKVRALFSNYEQLDPKTGEKIKTGAFAKAKEEFTSPQEFSKKNEVILKGNKLFMGIQFSTKFLGAEDMLAFFPNERGMLKSLAFDESKRTGRSVADLMENPTSDMLRQAYYEAKRNTFNQNPEGYVGVLIEAINKFYNALDQSGGGGKAIGNLIRFNVMPFTRVLGNVLNATIDYTPLGMIRYFAYKSDNPNSLLNRQRKDQNGRPLWLDENGDRMVSPFKARDARRQAARVALGTILGSLLYFLTMSADDDDEDKWFISGAGPQDYKKYKQLMAAGWRPFSFHIGNVIISYKEWPVSGAFAVIGNLHDIQKYDGKTRPQDWLDKTIYATMGVASSFLDRSFASNAISTATALDRGDPKWVKRSLTSTTSSTIIPYNNMLRFIENTYNRDLYTPETIAQQAWASVPLVPKKGLPRRVNVFGMYEKKDPATARLAMTDNVGLVVPDTKKTREIFQTVRKNNLFLSETTKREHRVDPYVGKRGIPEEDKQYIWLQGKDHENFRVMRGTEYVRLLNEPQNYNLIMQYDKNKDKDELAALLTSLGRKATAYATEETLKAYQRGELKHKYNTYNKSREEED